RNRAGHNGVGMPSIIAVNVGDELEIADPVIDAHQIEIRGADEEYRRLVAAEEPPYVRDAHEFRGQGSLLLDPEYESGNTPRSFVVGVTSSRPGRSSGPRVT